jgi:hypothetical protein
MTTLWLGGANRPGARHIFSISLKVSVKRKRPNVLITSSLFSFLFIFVETELVKAVTL